MGAHTKFKKCSRPLFTRRTNHVCHKKSNPSCEINSLKIIDFRAPLKSTDLFKAVLYMNSFTFYYVLIRKKKDKNCNFGDKLYFCLVWKWKESVTVCYGTLTAKPFPAESKETFDFTLVFVT
jgi:hypothetical protein